MSRFLGLARSIANGGAETRHRNWVATLSDVQPLANEIARRSQRAIIAPLRTWLDRLEGEMASPTVSTEQAPV